MTELEDALRDTLRAHERDVDPATVRRDYAAIAAGDTRLRALLPVIIAGAVVAIVGMIVYLAWPQGGPAPNQPAGAPTSQDVAPPPPDGGSYRVWLSEQVIPAAGADIAAVLTGPAPADESDQETFGVGAQLDRWDGTQWQLHRNARLCMDFWECTGSLVALEEDFAVEDIGLGLHPSGVGPTTFLRLEGLDPGWYRLRQTSNDGVEASGAFEVVAEDVPVLPVGRRNVDHLVAGPALLAEAGRTIHVSRIPVPQQSADSPANKVGESLDLEMWTGGTWQPMSTLTVIPAPDDPYRAAPLVELPTLDLGAYRLVDRSQPGEAQAVIWITDDIPAASSSHAAW